MMMMASTQTDPVRVDRVVRRRTKSQHVVELLFIYLIVELALLLGCEAVKYRCDVCSAEMLMFRLRRVVDVCWTDCLLSHHPVNH